MARLSDPTRALLVVIDYQEAFREIVQSGPEIERRAILALRGAALFGVPAIVTEQYPQGLGTTTEAILDAADGVPVIEKTSFSCAGEPSFNVAVDRLVGLPTALQPAPEIILAGIESHVCVLQTAIDLLERGYEVTALEDAITARAEPYRANGLAQMATAGIRISNTESMLFEWCREKGNPAFKAMQALLR